jgi:outer membrane protein assembly factor BamE (lipoprotein component of BamABCDE complex)
MMTRTLTISIALLALVATSGCSRVRGHQGYLADATLVDAIKPGVDNRESVTRTLGRPTFAGQFDANDWYYIDRETKQLAFALPRATKQTLLRVSFDAAGNVTAVSKTGVEQIAAIRPMGDKTPTLGSNRSFFQEIFGNIGQVGSVGQGGATADNPDGGNN